MCNACKDESCQPYIQTLVERERHLRIKVALYAYAYEFHNHSIVNDHIFDDMCKKITPSIKTGRLDEFFVTTFSPHTGMWIHKHPELERIAYIYHRYFALDRERIVRKIPTLDF